MLLVFILLTISSPFQKKQSKPKQNKQIPFPSTSFKHQMTTSSQHKRTEWKVVILLSSKYIDNVKSSHYIFSSF